MVKTKKNSLQFCASFAFLLVAILILPSPLEAQFVVVTHAKSDIDSLSLEDLRRIFKGQSIGKQKETPLQIVEFDPACDAFYDKLYGQNAYSIAKHWLRLIFAGERVNPPENFSDLDKFLEYLGKNENTIGFLPQETFAALKNKSIKAVVVEGWDGNQSNLLRKKPGRRK